MDADAKKTTLRMIPYGLYVLTADDGKGTVGAATVNWVTQTAFNPPIVVVGVKADSGAYAALKTAGTFALNMLGVVGEVVDAHLRHPPAGRPDAAILEMKDLGDNVFYGG